MGKQNLAVGLFDVAATETIHFLSVIVGDLFDVCVATLATDPGMRSSVEQLLVYEKKSIIAVLLDSCQTPVAMTHETVVGIGGQSRAQAGKQHNKQY